MLAGVFILYPKLIYNTNPRNLQLSLELHVLLIVAGPTVPLNACTFSTNLDRARLSQQK
jgi:hypothetical protein